MKNLQDTLKEINNTIENSYGGYLTLKDGEWVIRRTGEAFKPVKREYVNVPVDIDKVNEEILESAKEIYEDYEFNQQHNENATVSQRAVGDDDEGYKIGNNVRGGIY